MILYNKSISLVIILINGLQWIWVYRIFSHGHFVVDQRQTFQGQRALSVLQPEKKEA